MELGEQWVAAMRRQQFDRAWQISDRVLQQRRAFGPAKHTGPRHLQHVWQGEPLEGARVLVRCYHGLGDTIQFIRFAKPLRRLARSVIVWCQPELQSLISRIPDIDDVLPLHDGTVEADFDVDIELMELAHALRVRNADLAAEVSYLNFTVPAHPTPPHEHGLRVGVVWQAGDWDDRRSIPKEALEPLSALKGVRLYSLRPGADIEGTSLIDWSSPQIETLAARMSSLDVVVSVDTMAAHLAGALGLPVWTLLHTEPDWRWGTGTRCVWYPTMRLFRQKRQRDWSAPIAEIANSVRELMVRART